MGSQKHFPFHTNATFNSVGFCIRLNGTEQVFTPLTIYPTERKLVREETRTIQIDLQFA